MIQPKYTPEEALAKVKLMMKYDLSKTLNENAGIISEQTQGRPKFHGRPSTGDVALDNIFDSLAAGVWNSGFDAGTNEEELMKGLSLITNKQLYDKINQLLSDNPYKGYSSVVDILNGELGTDNLPRAEQAKEYLRKAGLVLSYSIKDKTSDGRPLARKQLIPGTFKIGTSSSLKPTTDGGGNTDVSKPDWSKYPCVTNHPNTKKSTLSNGSVVYVINKVVYYNNGRKKLSDGKMVNYTCNDPEFKKATQQVEIPKELKDANGIKIFQDWLDVNAAGWATGYKEGIINKGQNGGGYGKFGPRTQKAWNDTYLRERFLSRNSEEMTKMEPTKINQLPTSTNDNVGSDNKVPEVPSEDSTDIINNY